MRCQMFVPITEQSPACDSGHEKNAGSDCKQRPSTAAPMRISELREITVAGTAGTQMLEPFVRFRKRHLMRGDLLENVGAGAPNAVRIGELLEQTTA